MAMSKTQSGRRMEGMMKATEPYLSNSDFFPGSLLLCDSRVKGGGMKVMTPGALQDAIGHEFSVTVDESGDIATITSAETEVAVVDFTQQSIDTMLSIKWGFYAFGQDWVPFDADLNCGMMALNGKLRSRWESFGFVVSHEVIASSYEPDMKPGEQLPLGLVWAMICPATMEMAVDAMNFILMEDRDVWITENGIR
jgi:hypothetical protein